MKKLTLRERAINRLMNESKKTYIDPWDNREYSQEEVDEWIRKFKVGKRRLSAKDKRIYKDFFKRVGVDPKLLVKQSYWTTETKPKLDKILKKMNAPKDFRKDVLFIFKRIDTATNSMKGGMSYAQLHHKYNDYDLMMAQERVGHPNHYFGDDKELKKMWKDLNKEMGFVSSWEFSDMMA